MKDFLIDLDLEPRRGNQKNPLFDNKDFKEFLTPAQVAEFLGYSEKWVAQKIGDGSLPIRSYGRDKFFIYAPDLKQALLDGSLASRKVQNDQKEKNKDRKHKVRCSRQGEGTPSIQDLRQQT